MSEYTQDQVIHSKEGTKVLRRLLKYAKPYWLSFLAAVVMVLSIAGLDVLWPMLIGNAIDDYISNYGKPYAYVEENAKGAVSYNGRWLSETYEDADAFARIVLHEDSYYLFEDLTQADLDVLAETGTEAYVLSGDTLTTADLSGVKLTSAELRELRKSDRQGIADTVKIFGVIIFIKFFLDMGHMLLLHFTGQRIIYSIRKEVFEHIENLSLRFFDINPVGKLVTRVTNDTEALSDMYTNILIRMIRSVVCIAGYGIIMLVINAKLALLAFALLPVVIWVTMIMRRRTRAIYRVVRSRLTDINTFLSENLSGMKIIQIFSQEDRKYKEMHDKNEEYHKAGMKETFTFAIFRPVVNILYNLSLALVIYNGANGVLKGTLSVGVLYMFLQYIGSFFDPIMEFSECFGTLQSSLASGEKIFTVLDEKPMITEDPDAVELNDIKGKIEFDHVWFAYNEKDYVLKDVSFTIEPGTSAAFVGATGAGKSSILNLIGRYYEIQKGTITIDGVDIRKIRISSLRKAIGQVQQDVFIFAGDVRHNICLDHDMSQEEIEQAAKFVNADRFIEKLPDKYDTELNERGTTLSVGERQLLSFARTLAQKPNILVLDEATANIDTETEQLIQEATEKLMRGRTTIMVAHRLSTIQNADKIIVMSHGRIKEEGTHQELLHKNGVYKKLYDLQLLEEKTA